MNKAPLIPQEIIRKKRDGGTLTQDEVNFMVAGLTDGSITEGQIAAFAMAVFFNGMTMTERAHLTRAMAASGTMLDWRGVGVDAPRLDKHSTGGVGDKVSLMLAPMVAACGGAVPMISGRGLGHSGGTLDKFDAVPGYNTTPGLEMLRKVVKDVGCAVIGQTADLAPADRRFYGIRDVTATVESIPLITASILSKKLAAGLDGLVMDVKFGTGAFMQDYDKAKELADSIATVAAEAGLSTVAVLTDMNQVLGRSAGNGLEMHEAIDYLTGKQRDPRLHDVTMTLCAEMLVLGKLQPSMTAARQVLQAALDSGRAAEKFQAMVTALGGPSDLLDMPSKHLAPAPKIVACYPPQPGYVSAIDTRSVGIAVLALGGGRRRADDKIDYRVGLTDIAGIGEETGPNRPLAVIHAATDDAARQASLILQEAFKIGPVKIEPGRLIGDRLERLRS